MTTFDNIKAQQQEQEAARQEAAKMQGLAVQREALVTIHGNVTEVKAEIAKARVLILETLAGITATEYENAVNQERLAIMQPFFDRVDAAYDAYLEHIVRLTESDVVLEGKDVVKITREVMVLASVHETWLEAKSKEWAVDVFLKDVMAKVEPKTEA